MQRSSCNAFAYRFSDIEHCAFKQSNSRAKCLSNGQSTAFDQSTANKQSVVATVALAIFFAFGYSNYRLS